MHQMTPAQREYAEQNHAVVYAFLKTRKLTRDDFYDIVIFGYLEAVQQYAENEELRQRFRFSTIAFRKMDDKVAAHWIRENRQKRKADVYSIDAPIPGTEDLTYADSLPSADKGPEDQVVDNVISLRVLQSATPKQRAAIQAKAHGYTASETAEMLGTTSHAIDCCIHKFRTKARAVSPSRKTGQ